MSYITKDFIKKTIKEKFELYTEDELLTKFMDRLNEQWRIK